MRTHCEGPAPGGQYSNTLCTTKSVRKLVVHHRVRTQTHCAPSSQFAKHANTLSTDESLREHIVHCAPPSQYVTTLYTTESVRKHIVHHWISMRTHSTRTHCAPTRHYVNILCTNESGGTHVLSQYVVQNHMHKMPHSEPVFQLNTHYYCYIIIVPCLSQEKLNGGITFSLTILCQFQHFLVECWLQPCLHYF